MAVDLQHAEQGATVRAYFVVLSTLGVPTVPVSLVVTIKDAPTSTIVVTLTPVATDPGKYYVEWPVSLAQLAGFYFFDIDADNGGGPSSFTDQIRFELFAAGTFVTSVAVTPVSTVSLATKISGARNEEVFVALVRSIMRDHKELNRLTVGRETSDGEIRIAMIRAISYYNTKPPLLGPSSFSSFPSLEMLILGTIGKVLESSILLRVRNTLNYSDGGTNVETENVQGHVAVMGTFWPQYQQWVADFKISKNLQDAWGMSPTGTHSEYYLLASLLGESGFGTFVS